MTTLYLTHPACLDHLTPPGHPERPERLRAVEQVLAGDHFQPLLRALAPEGSLDSAALCHDNHYIDELRHIAPKDRTIYIDGDTSMSPGTWEAVLRAVGGAVAATDAVLSGACDNAFVAVRPPGHHAEVGKSMGFCFFDNAAIAARHAQRKHGLGRVAIVDFDVHHGNGTEDCFTGDQRVLMVSTFQHPFYPYSGTDSRAPNMLNVPLGRGADGEEFRTVVSEQWMPRLREFQPEMILISAGFDAHYEDEMGGLKLLERDYAWVTAQLTELAEECAQQRIVSMLEGGYALSALARSVVAHLRVLADF